MIHLLTKGKKMKKSPHQFFCVSVILLLSFIYGCQQHSEKVDLEADIAAIHALYDQYCDRANAGDLEGWLSLWLDNAIRMEPDAPTIFGKENIRTRFKIPFEQFKTEIAIYGETEVWIF
jgi:hypothetical protein